MKICTFFRNIERRNTRLTFSHLKDISNIGCNKPCKYKKYRMNWDRRQTTLTNEPTDGFGLVAITNLITVGKISLQTNLPTNKV